MKETWTSVEKFIFETGSEGSVLSFTRFASFFAAVSHDVSLRMFVKPSQ